MYSLCLSMCLFKLRCKMKNRSMFLLATLIHYLKPPGCINYANNDSGWRNVLTLHKKSLQLWFISIFICECKWKKSSIFFKSDSGHFHCLHGPILGNVTRFAMQFLSEHSFCISNDFHATEMWQFCSERGKTWIVCPGTARLGAQCPARSYERL